MSEETSDHLSDRVDALKSSITGTVEGLKEKAGEIAPAVGDVRDRARTAAGLVRENPLGLFFGAAAIGFLIGSLVPASRIERQRLGPIGDQLKERAQERIQETISQAVSKVSSA